MMEDSDSLAQWLNLATYVRPGGERLFFLAETVPTATALLPEFTLACVQIAKEFVGVNMLLYACKHFFGEDVSIASENFGYLLGYLSVGYREMDQGLKLLHPGWPECVKIADRRDAALDCIRVAIEYTVRVCTQVLLRRPCFKNKPPRNVSPSVRLASSRKQ
jgi:hypothetical protein